MPDMGNGDKGKGHRPAACGMKHHELKMDGEATAKTATTG
jgi:hypothetical protein